MSDKNDHEIIDQDKLDLLAKRIQEAEVRASGGPKSESPMVSREDVRGSHIWLDMLATLLASMFLGWVFDEGFGTTPWGLILMIPVGFAIIMVNIWRALAQQDKDENGQDKAG